MTKNNDQPQQFGSTEGGQNTSDAEKSKLSFIDTHCHMCNGGFNADRDEAYQRARAAGVDIIVNVGTGPDCWQDYIDDAKARDNVFLALGLHPNDAEAFSADAMKQLGAMLTDDANPIAALGEIGLDTFRDYCPLPKQEEAFLAQLELAASLNLPYQIHCRSEEERLLGCINETNNTRGLWHCFTGDTAMMRRALDLDLYIGIGGVSTYKSAQALKEAIRFAPKDKIVIETDAPYLAPTPYRGKRNEPAYIAATAMHLATIWEMQIEDVARQLLSNTLACLPALTGRS